MKPPSVVSNISNIYPSLRDENPKNIYRWLDGKRMDDRAEGLWRIHNTLYDFENFIESHPGGSVWLQTTKGTDITEAFESHHFSKGPQNLLVKFAVRTAKEPRIYKFTFDENGFYRTLKRRVQEQLKTIDETPKVYSKIYNDVLLFSALFFAVIAAKYACYSLSILSGLSLALLAISGHNFLHQKQNWRRKMMNFAFLDYREWQISHVLSHHLYTNSLHDLEISLFEPIFCWLSHHPEKQKFLNRYGSWIYAPVVYSVLCFTTVIGRYSWPKQKLYFDHLYPLSIPLVMIIFTNTPLSTVFLMSLFIYTVCSFYFFLVGFNAAHHHPDSSRDGDILRKDMDWGLYQLTTVMERSDIRGSQFLTQTHFGEHTLHHLCPTLDHGLLPQLNPIFEKTCKEFGVTLVELPWWGHILGQFRQMARLDSNDFSKKPFIRSNVE